MVIVISSGEFKFGIYLSHSISHAETWVGSPASFIFSITLDLKFPYHGKQPPRNRSKGNLPSVLFCGSDHFEAGNGDFYINESLTIGSSELEGCFGVGITRGSEINSQILAGTNNFHINHLEMWLVV